MTQPAHTEGLFSRQNDVTNDVPAPTETTVKVDKVPMQSTEKQAHDNIGKPGTESPPRSRVIYLHGGFSNHQIQKEITLRTMLSSPERSALADLLDISFIDAPHPTKLSENLLNSGLFPNEDLRFKYPDHFSWGSDLKNGYKESIEHIERYYKENGPFDGLIGHCEGALFAELFMLMQHRGEVSTQFKYAVFVIPASEIVIGLTIRQIFQDRITEKVPTPVAYAYNEDDWFARRYPKSTKETKYFSNVLVVTAPGEGHFPPRLLGDNLDSFCQFVKSSTEQRALSPNHQDIYVTT